MRAPLHQYQIAGGQFLVVRDRGFLGDDTGLGKSAQTIAAAVVRGARRILILCPAVGRVSWAIEVPKWQDERRVLIVDSQTKEIPSGPVAVVLSYDAVSRITTAKAVSRLLSRAEKFDVVVLDEAHYLKNIGSNRTRVVYGRKLDLSSGLIHSVLAPGGAVWALSGTVQKGSAFDLYPHISALFPAVFTRFFKTRPTPAEFVERFCITQDTPFGTKIVGNNRDAVANLAAALKPYFLARRKRDVMPELGKVIEVTLPLDVGEHFENKLDEIDPAGDRNVFLDEVEKLDVDAPTPAPAAPHVMAVWRALGAAKIAPALAWINDFLDADPTAKLVVFAQHREVITTLQASLGARAVSLHGGTSPTVRADAVRRFQEADDVRVFIGQTVAAGTSITLTAASTVLLLEQTWTPADDYQAISRVHRLGQKDPVTVFRAYAHGTIDERIARVALRKSKDFEALMGNLVATADSRSMS